MFGIKEKSDILLIFLYLEIFVLDSVVETEPLHSGVSGTVTPCGSCFKHDI
jgi:hypothetical protein